MLVLFSLLITQLKYEISDEIISPESWFKLKINDYDTVREKMIEKINALDDNDQSVAPNTELACAGNYTLTWEWAFTSSGNDAKDTILGQIVAGNETASGNYAGTTTVVQFSITISIEQIQEA